MKIGHFLCSLKAYSKALSVGKVPCNCGGGVGWGVGFGGAGNSDRVTEVTRATGRIGKWEIL